MKKTHQDGFAHVVMLLLVVVVLAAVAFAGYTVVSKNQTTKDSAASTATTVTGTVTLAPLPDNLSQFLTPEKLSQLIENTSTANATLKQVSLRNVNGKPLYDVTLSDGTKVAFDAATGDKVTPPAGNDDTLGNTISMTIDQLRQTMTVSTAKDLASKQKAAILAAIAANKVQPSTTTSTGTAGTTSASPSPSPSPTPAVTGTDNADKILNVVLVQNLKDKPSYDVIFKDGTKVTLPAVPNSVATGTSNDPCTTNPVVVKGKTYAVSKANDNANLTGTVVSCKPVSTHPTGTSATGPASRNPN